MTDSTDWHTKQWRELRVNVVSIDIAEIEVAPVQSRRHFSEESIERLAESFRQVGQLQPVIVRRSGRNYRLIAGERRVRAALRLGLSRIEAVVLNEPNLSEKQIQLVENLQRQDLDPVERAQAVREYMEEEGLSKAAAARRLSIPRTTLNEWLAVFDVPGKYQQAVLDNYNGGDSPLTTSHLCIAKALAATLNDTTKEVDLLEAVLTHELTRGEARRLAEVIRQNPELSVEEALEMTQMESEEEDPNEEEEREERDRTLEDVNKDLRSVLSALSKMLLDPETFNPSERKEHSLQLLLDIHDAVERSVKRNYSMPVEEAREKMKKRFWGRVV